MGFFSWFMGAEEKPRKRTARAKARPAAPRKAAVRSVAKTARTHTAPASDPVRRAQVLGDKGARRSDAEEREFKQLVDKLMRNPATLERKLKTEARRKFPKDVARQNRYVFGTLNRIKGNPTTLAQRIAATERKNARDLQRLIKLQADDEKRRQHDLTMRGLGSKRNPSESAELQKAKRISTRFHGSPAEVFELTAAERKPLPRYVVAIGDLEATEYRPDKYSQRGKSTWRHASGDTGGFTRRKGRPLLVVDPTTMQPAIVPNRSGQKFSSARGLVG